MGRGGGFVLLFLFCCVSGQVGVDMCCSGSDEIIS